MPCGGAGEQDRKQWQNAGRQRRQRARKVAQQEGGGAELHAGRAAPGRSAGDHRALSNSAAMAALSVCPVERPTSLPPLKTTKVLCIVTPRRFFRASSVSKSAFSS